MRIFCAHSSSLDFYTRLAYGRACVKESTPKRRVVLWNWSMCQKHIISSNSNTIWEGLHDHLRRKTKVSIFDLLYFLHLASYYETWDDNLRELRWLTRYDNSQFDPTGKIVLGFGSAHNGGMWDYISYMVVHWRKHTVRWNWSMCPKHIT